MYCYYANNSYLCSNVYHYVVDIVCNLQNLFIYFQYSKIFTL